MFHLRPPPTPPLGDYLGGEAYWAGGLHLYTPLPFRPGQGGFGELFRTHFFLNAGNLCNLNYGKPGLLRARCPKHSPRQVSVCLSTCGTFTCKDCALNLLPPRLTLGPERSCWWREWGAREEPP